MLNAVPYAALSPSRWYGARKDLVSPNSVAKSAGSVSKHVWDCSERQAVPHSRTQPWGPGSYSGCWRHCPRPSPNEYHRDWMDIWEVGSCNGFTSCPAHAQATTAIQQYSDRGRVEPSKDDHCWLSTGEYRRNGRFYTSQSKIDRLCRRTYEYKTAVAPRRHPVLLVLFREAVHGGGQGCSFWHGQILLFDCRPAECRGRDALR